MWLSQLGRWLGLVVGGAMAGMGPLIAEVMTLSDSDGRSITADVIELDSDVVKIKREDGVFFDLPLNRLNKDDQKKIVDWAAKEAAREAALPLPANTFDIIVSRTKFESNKTSRKVQYLVTYNNGSTTTEYQTEYSVNEQWGYGITLSNRLLKPVDGLRVEYRIYTKSGDTPALASSGTLNVGKLKARDKQVFKTAGIAMSYSYMQGSPLPKSPGSQIYGIWLRIYRGNVLEKEYATPETLISTAEWGSRTVRIR